MAVKNPNPTKADVVRVIIAQELADAEKRLREAERSTNANMAQAVAGVANGASQNLGRARGEVVALTRLKDKVVRYMDRGDISVLIR